ncbi:hypothetical protein AB6A40_010459 [Gnathostoma spinigerum]|uniref:Pepsin inhibitor-3-like repeated domain-containing protein n=1 Tax=Gnathostoma spinigerum TaxID=75299 RepID=A0ABD6EUV7_9BILA
MIHYFLLLAFVFVGLEAKPTETDAPLVHESMLLVFNGTSCRVTNGELFINGTSKGNLTDEQKAEMREFFKSTQKLSDAFQQSIMRSFQKMLKYLSESFNRLFGEPSETSKTVADNQTKPKLEESLIDDSSDDITKDLTESSLSFKPPSFCY